MKLILSRKGFDSSAGGGPSPILPDGTLLSLPIPAPESVGYETISAPDGRSYAEIMAELEIPIPDGCHLDPDLEHRTRPRAPGWRPAFGSVGAAGRHLQGQGVASGDLFLFFGWFRPTRIRRGQLEFLAGPDLHVVFGYLRVGEVLPVGPAARLPAWLHDHAHADPELRVKPGNTIFTAAPGLGLAGLEHLRGGGLMPWAKARVLTARGRTRSRWALPRPVFKNKPITYHTDDAWRDGYFQSAKRGQEFVTGADRDVLGWASRLIAAAP